MNTNFALEIIELALSIVKSQTTGTVQQDAGLAAALVSIIGKAVQAYEQNTGQPLDASLIKAEPPL
ncbi:MAG TPA: hypothetical protein VGK48_17540 [Terriglobia bacterium]|jgi:hypothetical protein